MTDEESIEIQIWKLAKKFINHYPSFVKYFDNDFEDYLSTITLYSIKSKDLYDPEKGKLGIWCYKCFRTAVQNYCKKKRLSTISLNTIVNESYSLNGESSVELQDIISENKEESEDFYEKLDAKISCDKIVPYMSKELYSHFFENKSISDLARLSGTTVQNIYDKLSKELFQLKKFIETNNPDELTILNRTNSKKEKDNYIKNHKCSIRTYYRRKAEGKLWNF